MKLITEADYRSMKRTIDRLNTDIVTLQDSKQRHRECINELLEIIESINDDCKKGKWCEKCEHRRTAYLGRNTINYSIEEVSYCGKNIKELCPNYKCCDRK